MAIVTKDLILAMKKANDSISVRIEKGTVTIHCNKKVNDNDPIFKTSNFFASASFEFPNDTSASITAYFSDSCRFNTRRGNYAALSLLLRENDEITFHVMDNSNCYLRNARINGEDLTKPDNKYTFPNYQGLHNDTLYVNINRKGKTILSDYSVDSVICPDNEARAIRNQ